MNKRIAICGSVGVLIAAFWAILSLTVHVTPADSVTWMLAQMSCPLVFLGMVFHFGVRVYWVIFANGIIYALVGLLWGLLRQVKSVPQPAESHN